MEYDELELDTLGDQKTALFVILSDTDSTFNFVAALMYSQLFNLLCDKADDFYGGRLPVHVRLILDEFANMPDFQLLCGGFPCQTFSIAGTRKGFGDPRGTLFFELARLAEARKPPYLLFENVPYVQKCIRYIMYTNQICIAPPKNSGARLFLLCFTVHNMFLSAKR